MGDKRQKVIGQTKASYHNEGKEFQVFVNRLRKEKGYKLRQLCEGLCSHGTMEAMEKGEWEPDKLLQDSILERLGIAAEDYVHGLDFVDYERWIDRMHILHSITFCLPDRASELLEEYGRKYNISRRHERQFWLAMKAQVRRFQGCPEEELTLLFREAVELTIPGWEKVPLEGQILSVKELNLILEAERCRREGERVSRYREIAEYIVHSGLDGHGMAKIYPKAVYFLCRGMMRAGEEERETKLMLRYSGQAIEILRDHERMYYLWELVELRKELAREKAEELEYREKANEALHHSECCSKPHKSEAMRKLCRELEEWGQALEAAYAERGVPKETFEFCYLYVMKGVYCVNDVIGIRRKMLGLSQRQLCQGICDEKTLRRIEKRDSRSHKKIAVQLMGRLGLSGELTRTELVTDSREARQIMTELRKIVNAGDWEEAERLRLLIGELVPMEILCNQQALLNEEVLLKWKRGELEDGEFLAQMQAVLEMTLPYQAFLQGNRIYLTHTEQVCILNRMDAMEKGSTEWLACAKRLEEIYRFYINEEVWEGDWNMYEFAMGNVGSGWGDIGEYDKADHYDEIILEGCLRFRRMAFVSKSIYGRWWNHDMRKQKGIPTDKSLDGKKELLRCIQFSIMVKDKRGEQFCRRKLENMKG